MKQVLFIFVSVAFFNLLGCVSEPIGPIQYDENGHSCQQVKRRTPGWKETEITKCLYQPLPSGGERERR